MPPRPDIPKPYHLTAARSLLLCPKSAAVGGRGRGRRGTRTLQPLLPPPALPPLSLSLSAFLTLLLLLVPFLFLYDAFSSFLILLPPLLPPLLPNVPPPLLVRFLSFFLYTPVFFFFLFHPPLSYLHTTERSSSLLLLLPRYIVTQLSLLHPLPSILFHPLLFLLFKLPQSIFSHPPIQVRPIITFFSHPAPPVTLSHTPFLLILPYEVLLL